MEVALSSQSLLVLLLATFVFIVALFRFARSGSASKLPPGQLGWPIIRENLSFYECSSKLTQADFLKPRVSRYGTIFTSHLFGKLTVVSVEPEFNKWVMLNEGKLFKADYPTSFLKTIGKYGLVAVNGDLHRKLHSIAVNLLTGESLKSILMADVDTLVKARVEKWIGREIRLQHECHSMVSDLMCKQLLDLDPSELTREIEKNYFAICEASLCVPIAFPGSTFYHGLKARKSLDVIVYKAIRDREEHPEVPRRDLLTRLLREENPLSHEAIVDFIIFMLFAGHETSSRAMGISVKYITENPKVLQRLREEHDQLIQNKKGDKVTWEEYKSMDYTQRVIDETLRIANVSPMIPRVTLEDVPAQGYIIPKGTAVLLMPNWIHKDKANYDSPLTFNPDRWLSLDEMKLKGDPRFVPFGAGSRMCPGSQLARLEMTFLLHHFVTQCRWEMTMQDRITEFPFPAPVEGLPMRVYPRDDK